MAEPRGWDNVDEHEDIRGAIADVLVVTPGTLAGCRADRDAGFADELARGLVEANHRVARIRRRLVEGRDILDNTSDDDRARHFPRLEAMKAEALPDRTLTVESCDNCERDMRDWLQDRIDAEALKVSRLRDKIIKEMENYRNERLSS
jgi:uncharacterized protein YPO0396